MSSSSNNEKHHSIPDSVAGIIAASVGTTAEQTAPATVKKPTETKRKPTGRKTSSRPLPQKLVRILHTTTGDDDPELRFQKITIRGRPYLDVRKTVCEGIATHRGVCLNKNQVGDLVRALSTVVPEWCPTGYKIIRKEDDNDSDEEKDHDMDPEDILMRECGPE